MAILEAPAPPPPRSMKCPGSPSPQLAVNLTRSTSDDMTLTPVNGHGIDRFYSPEQVLSPGPNGISYAAKAGFPSHGLTNGRTLNGGSDTESDYESDEEEERDVIHVEVRLRPHSRILASIIETNLAQLLMSEYDTLSSATLIPDAVWEDIAVLGDNVERVYVAECGDVDQPIDTRGATFAIHVYHASRASEEAVAGGMEEDEDEDRTAAAMLRDLPLVEYESLWDNLIYEDDIKPRLLGYMRSAIAFSDSEVDFNVISWNRLILLFGPPGTGKTSLCRALAHKLLVRLSDTYTHGKLVEINSHSLFSKWFSESGKLVQKIFDKVHDLISDENCFVVVMIDEVESLTVARSGALTGNEPSDALRVVNALLTQLDKLKSHRNVLVMTTSNLAGSIDPAFVDRADLKQNVGLPPPQAIYWILASCLRELHARGLAPGGDKLLDFKGIPTTPFPKRKAERGRLASLQLREVADLCYAHRVSGRFIRKVPLMAHARYLGEVASIDKWVKAIKSAVEDEISVQGDIRREEEEIRGKPVLQ